MIGQDCDIRTLSKVNLTQQNRHIDVTFDNICQLILAEIQWKAKNCMKKIFFCILHLLPIPLTHA